ncbi:heat shock 70 kDa protein 12A-like [Mytilus trossulus]|uniref:heat shock 70 kDa protein 12A-like n=1 Tax=Mytilus trossulus TaxID=6551 RepID=UPI0030048F03
MFENFKLELYKRMDITAEMEIKDGYGRSKLAIDVYTAVLNDLKQKALIHTGMKNIEEIDISWIMTVPDVWNESARNFIQLSCENSGIPKEQMIIVDESTAILTYFQDVQYFCKEKIISQTLDDKNYLLIDLGGGTCDITGYHVTADCDVGVPIESTHIACGFDIACDALLDRISSMIGDRAMDCLKEEETVSFLQLKEKCLQLVKTSEYSSTLNVPIRTFNGLCKRFRLMSFEETVDDFGKTPSCGNSERLDIDFKLSGDNLIVRKGLIVDSLNVVIKNVITEIKHILKTQKAQDIQQFFIVGGFSSLFVVQNEIMAAFKEKTIFFANDKVYASVKGALLCGCNNIRMKNS